MADDDKAYETWLAAARPRTPADDGWAASPEGDQALIAIHRTAGRPVAVRRRRPLGLFAGGFGLAGAAAVMVVALAGSSTPVRPPAGPPPVGPRHVAGPRPENMALVAYDSCPDMLAGLRSHAAAQVGAYGLPGQYSRAVALDGNGSAYAKNSAAAGSGSAPVPAPDHSSTNVQESGVDEPDIVKTDGKRVVTITGGVLRVTGTATKTITGTLDLTMYANAQSAQLLVIGDHALVVLDPGNGVGYAGGYAGPDVGSRFGGAPADTGSTYLLVDLAGQPRVTGTFHPTGGYVDARMVGSTVRLVVANTPKIVFPNDTRPRTDAQRTADNKAIVTKTPLDAWLPSYEVTTGGTTVKRSVPCQQVSHPASYTGTSMLTIYTIDLTKSLDDTAPISLAADGDTVYATSSSLYVASNPNWWSCYAPCRSQTPAERTEIHRFDITGDDRPTYLGSGSVPGRLLSQYSLSDYGGYLRIATTTGQFGAKTETSVYVLAADTLKVTGHVGGLGKGEQIYAVRFLGELGYVVTFRQLDPLYVVDLRDPKAPRVASELTITGYSDYLHPVGDGRLVGVGQEGNSDGRVTGVQVSLFDVSKPTAPKRLARVVRSNAPGEQPLDPHAFLYWPAANLLVVPIQTWQPAESGKVLVLKISGNSLVTIGLISNPSVTGSYNGGLGIGRSMVIGSNIWTLSDAGLKVSALTTLAGRAWIAFS